MEIIEKQINTFKSVSKNNIIIGAFKNLILFCNQFIKNNYKEIISVVKIRNENYSKEENVNIAEKQKFNYIKTSHEGGIKVTRYGVLGCQRDDAVELFSDKMVVYTFRLLDVFNPLSTENINIFSIIKTDLESNENLFCSFKSLLTDIFKFLDIIDFIVEEENEIHIFNLTTIKCKDQLGTLFK